MRCNFSSIHNAISRASVAILALAALSVSAATHTRTLDLYKVLDDPGDPGDPSDDIRIFGRGEYRSDGRSFLNRTFVGESFNPISGKAFTYYSYFIFDLSNENVHSGHLRLELVDYMGPDASETLSLHGVASLASDVWTSHGTSPEGELIFNAIGTGTEYATVTVDKTVTAGTILDAELPPQAIADLNAANGGFFVFGLALDSNSHGSVDEGVHFSLGGETLVHQLKLEVPDGGSTLSILSLASLSCLAVARRARSAR